MIEKADLGRWSWGRGFQMNSDSAYRISRGKWYMILILKLKLSDCFLYRNHPVSLELW